MFVVYDPNGTILSTIAGPGLQYGMETLDPERKSWLFLAETTSLDPTAKYVDVAAAAARTDRYVPGAEIASVVKPNQAITLVASKGAIQADGVDTATISGIPAGAAVTVICNDLVIASVVADSDGLDLTAVSAGVYRVMVSRATFKPASIEVTAS